MNHSTTRVALAFALGALCFSATSSVARAQNENVIRGESAIHAPNLPPSDYYLARNSLVEIELLDSLDTGSLKRNQVFHYRVMQDIRGDGGVVIPRGSEGRGWVLESRKGTKLNPARLHLNFGEVPSVEGKPVKLGFLESARRANENLGGGLTPIIGGYFESTERQAVLPAGLHLFTCVEFPYGTRRIRAGEDGAKYHLFSNQPVRGPGL